MTSAQFRVDSGNTFIRRSLGQLSLGTLFIQDVADPEDAGEFHALLMETVASVHTDIQRIHHGTDAALVEIDAILRLQHSFPEELVCDPLAGSAVPFPRKASVHFPAVGYAI